MSLHNCTCPIQPGMTYEELSEIVQDGRQCCDIRNAPGRGWMCSVMSKALDKADVARQARYRHEKQLKREGFSSEDIANMPRKSRRRKGIAQSEIPNLEF